MGTVVSLVLLGDLFHPTWVPLRFWTNSIMLEFAAGLVLAAALPDRRSAPWSIILMLGGVLGLGIQALVDPGAFPRVVGGGIPALLLVAGVAVLPAEFDRRIPGWITLLGDSSYALYLGHRFVLRAATVALDGLPLGQPSGWIVYCLIVTSIAVVASVLTYRWFERPLLIFGRRFLPRSRPSPPSLKQG